jgi:hypothetical protein
LAASSFVPTEEQKTSQRSQRDPDVGGGQVA